MRGRRRIVFGVGAATLAASAIVACTSDDDASSGGHDAGTLDATAHDGGASDATPPGNDATTGDASNGDGAAGDGASGDAAIDSAADAPFDAASEPVQGEINLVIGYNGPGGPPGSSSIGFVQTASLSSTCTTTFVAGGCMFSSCPDETVTAPSYADADTGQIDLSFQNAVDGGDPDAGYLVFVPSDAGPGPYVAIEGPIPTLPGRFAGGTGETVLTTGLGDPASLGPFSLHSVIPGRVQVTAPPLTFRVPGHEGGPATYSTSFPHTKDLNVSYTGGVPGTVARIVLTTTSSSVPYPQKQLICDFDETATAVTIAAQNGLLLLDDVVADGGALAPYSGSMQVFGRASAVVPDGDAAIVETITVDPFENIDFTNSD